MRRAVRWTFPRATSRQSERLVVRRKRAEGMARGGEAVEPVTRTATRPGSEGWPLDVTMSIQRCTLNAPYSAKMHLILRVSHFWESPQVLAFQDSCGVPAHRSISPITMSILPTTAGTSAMRQSRQISSVTLRLAKHDERARTRNGTMLLLAPPTT